MKTKKDSFHTSIIAHRGASGLAKQENTIEAFQIAISIQADMVEFDVRQTKDLVLVIYHDRTIEHHRIGDLTYEELQKLAHQKGFGVPTFQEVLKLCQGRIRLDIELKETGFEQEVVTMVKKYYDYSQYSIKSFIDEVSLKIKKIDERITTGLLVGHETADLKTRLSEYFPERRLKKCRADFISPHYYFVTKEFLARMRRKNIPIYVWTVNDHKLMKKFLNCQVTGIITDYPDQAIAIQSHCQ